MAKQNDGMIILPKKLRAEWVDVMGLDPKLSDNAFRVACIIGSRLNSPATHEALFRLRGRSGMAAGTKITQEFEHELLTIFVHHAVSFVPRKAS